MSEGVTASGIVWVSYRRLQSFGHYENEEVGAGAAVNAGADPSVVLAGVQAWVCDRLSEHIERRREEDEVRDIDQRIANREGQIKRLEERWERAREFLKKHGVDPGPVAYDDDPPF